jgi:dolichol-phosphate mannosyltransferase
MDKNIHISVVSPVYGCCTSLLELHRRLKITLESITNDFEIILVNDASPDNAWNAICEICKCDDRVLGINLSRNFGQHHAITAGLDHAHGEWIVVMDCDLQDQPEEIIKLYAKALNGYDIVLARRFLRQDNFMKRIFSKLFYRTLYYLTGSNQDETVANFGIYSRKVIDEIKKLRESIRYFPTMINWIGFRTAHVDVRHSARFAGKTGYSFNQ